MKPIISILVLLLATIAAGQDVQIDGPDQIDVGSKPVRLTIKGTTVAELTKGGAKLIWYPRDSFELWDAASWSGEPYLLAFTSKPGKYLVAIAFVRDGQQVYAEHELQSGEEPGPNPPPPPPPVPTPGERWIILIEESSQRTPQLAALVTSQTLRDYVSKNRHKMRVVDKDTIVPAALAPYLELSRGESLPLLFIVDSDGNVLFEGPPPATDQDAIQLLKKHGG